MGSDQHDWIVFHHVRFSAPIDGAKTRFRRPKAAEAWRFTPQTRLNQDGSRNVVNDVWGGFGVYSSRKAAEDVLDQPERAFPFLSEANEIYHVLLAPFAHRGDVNWRGSVQSNDTIASRI